MSKELEPGSESALSLAPVTPPDQLLSLGDIASRHLIARTSQTDIIVRSLEELAGEAENKADLGALLEGVTRPYQELFVAQSPHQSAKKNKFFKSKNKDKPLHSEWSFLEHTDGGTLNTSVRYQYDCGEHGVNVRQASATIEGRNDATAVLGIDFIDNAITGVSLEWLSRYAEAPQHPYTLLKKLEGTELGEVVDKLLNPLGLSAQTGMQDISFRLGQLPEITSSRRLRYPPASRYDNGVVAKHSDFQYHPGKNLFLRQHGLGETCTEDNLTALTPAEAAVVLHQMLSLIPAVSIN